MRTTMRAVAVGMLAIGLAVAPAQAQTWAGTLSGNNQVPPIPNDPASGFSTVTLAGNALTVNVNWAGLTGGPAAAAHIHCCALPGANAPVAVGFVNFPAQVAGSYAFTFDLLALSTYNGGYLSTYGLTTATAARDLLVAGLNGGQAYVNIHNATYPGGEIRANLATVPEPGTYALVGAGLAGLGAAARRRRSTAGAPRA